MGVVPGRAWRSSHHFQSVRGFPDLMARQIEIRRVDVVVVVVGVVNVSSFQIQLFEKFLYWKKLPFVSGTGFRTDVSLLVHGHGVYDGWLGGLRVGPPHGGVVKKRPGMDHAFN